MFECLPADSVEDPSGPIFLTTTTAIQTTTAGVSKTTAPIATTPAPTTAGVQVTSAIVQSTPKPEEDFGEFLNAKGGGSLFGLVSTSPWGQSAADKGCPPAFAPINPYSALATAQECKLSANLHFPQQSATGEIFTKTHAVDMSFLPELLGIDKEPRPSYRIRFYESSLFLRLSTSSLMGGRGGLPLGVGEEYHSGLAIVESYTGKKLDSRNLVGQWEGGCSGGCRMSVDIEGLVLTAVSC